MISCGEIRECITHNHNPALQVSAPLVEFGFFLLLKIMTESKRLKVFNKNNGRCSYCNKKLHSKCNIILSSDGLYRKDCKYNTQCFEVEHIVPKSKGGSSKLSNLLPSCAQCNREKGSKTTLQWINHISLRIEEINKERLYLKNKQEFLTNNFTKI